MKRTADGATGEDPPAKRVKAEHNDDLFPETKGVQTEIKRPPATSIDADATAQTKQLMAKGSPPLVKLLLPVTQPDDTVYQAICDAYGTPKEKRDGKFTGAQRPVAFRRADIIRVKRLRYLRAPKTNGIFFHLCLRPPKAPVLIDFAGTHFKISIPKDGKTRAEYSGATKLVPEWLMAGELLANQQGTGLLFIPFDGLCLGTLPQRLEHIAKIKFSATPVFDIQHKTFVPAEADGKGSDLPSDGEIFAMVDATCAFSLFRSLLKLKEPDDHTSDLDVHASTWSGTEPMTLYSRQGTVRGTGICQAPGMKLEKVHPRTGMGVVECICVDRKERKYRILFERPEKVETGANADRTIDDTLDVQSEHLTRDEVLAQLRATKLSDTIPLAEMARFRHDFSALVLEWAPLPHAELEMRIHSPITAEQFSKAIKRLTAHVAKGDFLKPVRTVTVDTMYQDDIDQFSTYRKTEAKGKGDVWMRKKRKGTMDVRLFAERTAGSRAISDEFVDVRLALSVEDMLHPRDVPKTLINGFQRTKDRVSAMDAAKRLRVELTVVESTSGKQMEIEVEAERTAENLRDPLMSDHMMHALSLIVGF